MLAAYARRTSRLARFQGSPPLRRLHWTYYVIVGNDTSRLIHSTTSWGTAMQRFDKAGAGSKDSDRDKGRTKPQWRKRETEIRDPHGRNNSAVRWQLGGVMDSLLCCFWGVLLSHRPEREIILPPSNSAKGRRTTMPTAPSTVFGA